MTMMYKLINDKIQIDGTNGRLYDNWCWTARNSQAPWQFNNNGNSCKKILFTFYEPQPISIDMHNTF